MTLYLPHYLPLSPPPHTHTCSHQQELWWPKHCITCLALFQHELLRTGSFQRDVQSDTIGAGLLTPFRNISNTHNAPVLSNLKLLQQGHFLPNRRCCSVMTPRKEARKPEKVRQKSQTNTEDAKSHVKMFDGTNIELWFFKEVCIH